MFIFATGCAEQGRPRLETTSPQAGTVVSADSPLTHEALRADVRELVQLLEETHPDPYLGAGGRVAFHRKVHDVLDAIPSEGMTVRQFLRLVRPLVASIRDGHTSVFSPFQQKAGRRAWVELEAVEQCLYVAGVYRDADRPALGGRIGAIEGVPWEEMLERMGSVRGYDNVYNNIDHLAQAFLRPSVLEDLLNLDTPLVHARIEVETSDRRRATVDVPVGPSQPGEVIRPASRTPLPESDAADLGWGFLTQDRAVAILRIDSMMRYREAFEIWRSTGFARNLGDPLTEVARRASGEALPEEIDERIARVPSATETFKRLFAAMREAGTSALVIDLRRNDGGNSFLNLILGYFLYPLEKLVEHDEGYQIGRFSRLYFESYGTATLEGIRSRRWPLLELGDLDFSEEQAWRRAKREGLQPGERRRRLQELAAYAAGAPTFEREYRSGEWNAAWSGRVIVVTSARTYSAGFDLTALLFQQGATIVGVPSSQAGNCFIDSLPFRLKHSGLSGSISYKRSLLFPDDPATGKILRPHLELTFDRLAAMNFDPHASVLLALDLVRRGKLKDE
ncbi:MAG: hypothetical protein HYY16_00790 [Planctomycetes bacterium]|nr:hypothetical protein [Planctomycetota bacterium]